MWTCALRGCKTRGKVTWYSFCLWGTGGHLAKRLANILEMVAERGGPSGAGVQEVHLGSGKASCRHTPALVTAHLPCPRATERGEGPRNLNGKFIHSFIFSSLQRWREGRAFQAGQGQRPRESWLSWQPHLALQGDWVRGSPQPDMPEVGVHRWALGRPAC